MSTKIVKGNSKFHNSYLHSIYIYIYIYIYILRLMLELIERINFII